MFNRIGFLLKEDCKVEMGARASTEGGELEAGFEFDSAKLGIDELGQCLVG